MPPATYAVQASVVIVKPGGTGMSSVVISKSPAPLPPRSSRSAAGVAAVRGASAWPLPNEYTYRGDRAPGADPLDLDLAAPRLSTLACPIDTTPAHGATDPGLKEEKNRRFLAGQAANPQAANPIDAKGAPSVCQRFIFRDAYLR